MAGFAPLNAHPMLVTSFGSQPPPPSTAFVDLDLDRQMPPQEQPMPYAFQCFLRQDRHNEPWVVPPTVPPTNFAGGNTNSGHILSTATVTAAAAAATAAGFKPIPSEYSKSPPGGLSDSGYGTGQPSLGIPSVYGDGERSYETQRLVGHLCHFNLLADASRPNQNQQQQQQKFADPTLSSAKQIQSFVCPDCQATVKTRSDLRCVRWSRLGDLQPVF